MSEDGPLLTVEVARRWDPGRSGKAITRAVRNAGRARQARRDIVLVEVVPGYR